MKNRHGLVENPTWSDMPTSSRLLVLLGLAGLYGHGNKICGPLALFYATADHYITKLALRFYSFIFYLYLGTRLSPHLFDSRTTAT